MICDVTYRRIDTWIRGGLIQSSGRPSNGKGTRRLFTFTDLIEIRVLRGLTERGVRLQALKEAIRQLRRSLPESQTELLASTRLVTNGKSVFRLIDEGRLEGLDEYGQFAFAFGFGSEVAFLVETVKNQRRPIRYVRKTEGKTCRKASAE